MSERDLARSINQALAKPVRDVTRYDDTKAFLAELLAVDKHEVGIKVVGDVAADFKNRIGEVTGRRSTRFIAVLLTCERRSLEEELESYDRQKCSRSQQETQCSQLQCLNALRQAFSRDKTEAKTDRASEDEKIAQTSTFPVNSSLRSLEDDQRAANQQ